MDRDPSTAPLPQLTVVVCTLNGAERLGRCLKAVQAQSILQDLEVIVVDDGSTDDSATVADKHGAKVIQHEVNRGVAAARNTGLRAAHGSLVAFLDDDCEPQPEWAERIISAIGPGVLGVGGPAVAAPDGSYLSGYLERNNPLAPLEIDLASGTGIIYRFGRYLSRNWRSAPVGRRPVYSFATANACFRASEIRELGGFDEHFRSGEDIDLCLSVGDAHGLGALSFEPEAVVVHHFETNLRRMLRRHRSYGTGVAQLYCKRRNLPLTVYPFPILVAALLTTSRGRPGRIVFTALLPQVLYGLGLRGAVGKRSLAPLLDCYMRLAEEANSNIGYAKGLWRYGRRPRQTT